MKTIEPKISKLSVKQKNNFDAILKIGLTYTSKLNKKNALKAVKCFEAIPVKHFPSLYGPLASSVFTAAAWFLTIDKNYKQAEIYLNRALESGTYLVPIRLGHIQYFQSNFKTAIDFYIQAANKLGFVEEIIMEIQDDFEVLKVSKHNTQNLIALLTGFNQDNTIDTDKLVANFKDPNKSATEIITDFGFWKYSKQENALIFSNPEIKISFNDKQNVIESFDEIKKHYARLKESIEALVSKIIIYQNKKILQNIIVDTNLEGQDWIWENWSLYNVVEEQDFEKRFGLEDNTAEIKVNVKVGDLEVVFL